MIQCVYVCECYFLLLPYDLKGHTHVQMHSSPYITCTLVCVSLCFVSPLFLLLLVGVSPTFFI